MKPAKPPKPKIGDQVRLRGRTPVGYLKSLGTGYPGWASVEWANGFGPGICHIDELELIDDPLELERLNKVGAQ